MDGERKKFIGHFERYGVKTGWKGYPEKTVLLRNINDGARIVADHIWFTMTKGFKSLGELQNGDRIEFCARVKEYCKGYVNEREDIDYSEIDYRLSHPTKMRRHESTQVSHLPE